MSKTVFITGTSTGLGRHTAIYFAKRGWNVVATMRSPEKDVELKQLENVRVVRLDVTDRDQVKEAVAAAIDAFGRVDVVVNNAGSGAYGALELAAEKDIDWQFAVNVRGPINVIRAFLPHFRENGGGAFINISSFMGTTPAVPLGSLYTMSKFALEGLYYELKPQGIRLHLVEMGGSDDNNFVNNIQWSESGEVEVYERLTAKLKHLMATAGPEHKSKMEEIVGVIYSLAEGENQRFRNPVGSVTQALLEMRAAMPIEEFMGKIEANFA